MVIPAKHFKTLINCLLSRSPVEKHTHTHTHTLTYTSRDDLVLPMRHHKSHFRANKRLCLAISEPSKGTVSLPVMLTLRSN